MNKALKIILIALLVGLTTIVVDAGKASDKQSTSAESNFLPLGLPNFPQVWLEGENSRSYERLINYEPPEIEFTFGDDNRETQEIGLIERIEFQGEEVWVGVNTKPEIKIRGGDSNVNRQETWPDIPLESFRVKSGEAEINLEAAIKDELDRMDIRDITRRETYVVDEIAFNGSESMTLKVIPRDL
jgi:hypothetical protein